MSIIEWLLSQDAVLLLLFEKLFPQQLPALQQALAKDSRPATQSGRQQQQEEEDDDSEFELVDRYDEQLEPMPL